MCASISLTLNTSYCVTMVIATPPLPVKMLLLIKTPPITSGRGTCSSRPPYSMNIVLRGTGYIDVYNCLHTGYI